MIIPTWLLVVLVFGATARLTRIVTADYVTRPMRTWINNRWGENRLSYFVTCDWCVSVWVSVPVTWAAIAWPTNRLVLGCLVALSASLFTGLITQLEKQ